LAGAERTVREVEVKFPNGEAVLAAYWGFLSDGGLVIQNGDQLGVGEEVKLRVAIGSRQSLYEFRGHVAKIEAASGSAVVAFAAGEPHDMLLSQALADADSVPPRRFRRFEVDLPVHVEQVGEEASEPVRMVNVSEVGCCFVITGARSEGLAPGATIAIRASGFSAEGVVVWQRHRERGVEFIEGSVDGSIEALLGAS